MARKGLPGTNLQTQSQKVGANSICSRKSKKMSLLESPVQDRGQSQETDNVFDLFQRCLYTGEYLTLSFGKCCISLEARVCVMCVSFSKFQAFYCQFESSWQNPQVFSVTDAWRRRMLGVLKQSNAQSWGSSCSALVTVYTTSPKVFRKQIILEPIPPIQNSGPFSSTHTFFSYAVYFLP